MTPTAGVGAHVRRAAEAGDAVDRRGRAVAGQVDLQRRADEQVARVMPGRLRERAVRAQRAVGAGEEHVRSRLDVLLHAQFGAERMDRLDEAGLDRRDQRRMRVQRPVPADLALQAERCGVGRQQQFDRGRVEADAVIQPLHAVRGVDALDDEHRHQHLDLGDQRRVAREQRLDVVRLRARDVEVDPVRRDVHARQPVDDLVDLRDDDAALERGRLDDRRRVLGVRDRCRDCLRGRPPARRSARRAASGRRSSGANSSR